MVEVVNLNQLRKKRRRTEKELTAAENRAKFGQTKAEKNIYNKSQSVRNRYLEGKKRANPKED